MTREEAIDCFEGLKIYLKTEHIDQEAIDMAIEALQAEPKHGEWIEERNITTDGKGYTAYRCSVCQCAVLTKLYNFCPNCGAKMDGD